MKANKTHISLETAKLLKDCGVESGLWFIQDYRGDYKAKIEKEKNNEWGFYYYPAYTWNEILWENAEKFFGKRDIMEERNKKIGQPALFFSGPEYKYHPIIILELLQQKKYQEADEYFRKHN
jgi:hypothetical protein